MSHSLSFHVFETFVRNSAMFEIAVVDCMIYIYMEEDNLRKPKQICWMAKNNNFSGNLIWRMTKNYNFWREFNLLDFDGFLTNPANPPKFVPIRYIS